MDNNDALREAQRVKKIANNKKNVIAVKIHSFEYILLSFEMFVDWVFAKEDKLKNDREGLLKARKLLLRMVSERIEASEQEELFKLASKGVAKNSEYIAASLLENITKNTGFATTKSKLGDCFVEDCCSMSERQPDDICGLDDNRLDAKTKRNMLVEHSVLRASFSEVGLI